MCINKKTDWAEMEDSDQSVEKVVEKVVEKKESEGSENMEIVDGDKVIAEKEAKNKDYKNR